MTKTELISDMRRSVDDAGFMNKSQLAKYLGIDRHNIKPYTDLCAPVVGKKYFIGDLADAIMSVSRR